MKRQSFVFYRSFFESIEKLKKNDKLTLYSHICRYALGEEVDEIDGVPAAIFNLIKPQIDANLRRYENGVKGAEHGKKGGRPRTPKEPQENPNRTPNVNVNVNDNVNENVNVNVNGLAVSENEKPAAVPSSPDTHTDTLSEPVRVPELSAIREENNEQGYGLDADSIEDFVEYNRSRGWKMDWRTALKKWAEKEHPPSTKRKPAGAFANFPQRTDKENADLVAKVISMGG